LAFHQRRPWYVPTIYAFQIVLGPATNTVCEVAIEGLQDAYHQAFARGTDSVTCLYGRLSTRPSDDYSRRHQVIYPSWGKSLDF
jgi:hypothetical protein